MFLELVAPGPLIPCLSDCTGEMSAKTPRVSRSKVPSARSKAPSEVAMPASPLGTTPVEHAAPPARSKALTVNVPAEALSRSKTRASLEGRTLSAIVTDALRDYGDGLAAVLTKLGLVGEIPGKSR